MREAKRYQPASSLESPRFSGIRTFMRLPHVQTTDGVDFAIIGIPFDDAVTYRSGARFGPEAVRSVSVMLRPYNPGLDVKVFDHLSGVDYGDVPIVPGFIHETYERIAATFAPVVKGGVVPVGLGGDHSVTLAELRAVAGVHGPVALVHFDSHLDTLNEYFGQKYNHGTPFRRAAEEGLVDTSHSIQLGMRGSIYSPEDYTDSRELGYDLMTALEIQDLGIPQTIQRIRDRVGNRPVFVSFDIDFLDPAYAPGTGTPEVGGFTGHETLRLLRGLEGFNFAGFDVVEVLPALDPGNITALMAAHVAYEFISLLALKEKRGGFCSKGEEGQRNGRA